MTPFLATRGLALLTMHAEIHAAEGLTCDRQQQQVSGLRDARWQGSVTCCERDRSSSGCWMISRTAASSCSRAASRCMALCCCCASCAGETRSYEVTLPHAAARANEQLSTQGGVEGALRTNGEMSRLVSDSQVRVPNMQQPGYKAGCSCCSSGFEHQHEVNNDEAVQESGMPLAFRRGACELESGSGLRRWLDQGGARLSRGLASLYSHLLLGRLRARLADDLVRRRARQPLSRDEVHAQPHLGLLRHVLDRPVHLCGGQVGSSVSRACLHAERERCL